MVVKLYKYLYNKEVNKHKKSFNIFKNIFALNVLIFHIFIRLWCLCFFHFFLVLSNLHTVNSSNCFTPGSILVYKCAVTVYHQPEQISDLFKDNFQIFQQQ